MYFIYTVLSFYLVFVEQYDVRITSLESRLHFQFPQSGLCALLDVVVVSNVNIMYFLMIAFSWVGGLWLSLSFVHCVA